MGSFCRLVGVVAFALVCSRATAQVPPLEPPAEREGPADYLQPECPAKQSPAATVDFIFGLPTGIRIQRAVDEERVWHLEGFAGLELFLPIVGGGIRRRYEPLCGRHDALVVAPGLDAYLLYNPLWNSDFIFFSGGPPFAGMFTADVDVLWRHCFTERCQGQLGFKLGGGAGYGARWGPAAVAGVFTGMRW